MDNIENYWDTISTLTITYGTKIVTALITLLIGLWVVKKISSIFRKAMIKRDIDESLRPFLSSLVSALLKVMLVITVAGMLDIQMTSFVAILGAAGLAVGLALQGSLSNFAGGILILILKPFKVGDYIDANGVSGTVREIQIFYTYITTVQNQEVVVPNAVLSNGTLTNYSFHNNRRLDMTFGIGYTDDIDKAKAIILDIVNSDENVLKDPKPIIFLSSLGDSRVNFNLRAWSTNAHYWDVVNSLNEKVKKRFDAEGVGIPFPQMDIHLHKD